MPPKPGSNAPPHEARSPLNRAAALVGAFLTVVLVAEYALALWRGRQPMGHPWSAISLALLAFVIPAQVRQAKRAPRWLLWSAVGLMFLSGILWLVANHVD